MRNIIKNTIKFGTALAAIGMTAILPMGANAQFYYAAPDLSGPPVTGAEPQLQLNLPGATAAEMRAGLLWHLRVAMNVAALQCDFEPSLLTVSNYNATLAHHEDELSGAFNTLTAYFQRTAGRGRAGQRALDQYNTKAYSSYSTVHAQRDFCAVMGSVGRDAIFAPRGSLGSLAQQRLGEVRKALVPIGDQYFTDPAYNFRATLPLFTKKCWKRDTLRDNCQEAWEKYAAKPGK